MDGVINGASILSNIKLKPPEFKKPGQYFVKSNTRLFYEYTYGEESKLSSDEFMELFCAGGDLQSLTENIWSWESPSRGTYEICFKKVDENLKKLEKHMSDHKVHVFKLPNGKKIHVKMDFPWQPVHQLTLRGVPTEYPLDNLVKDINLMKWGVVKSLQAGRHKNRSKWSNVRNNLLHVKLVEADLSMVPSIFWLCGHDVYVTKIGESIKE